MTDSKKEKTGSLPVFDYDDFLNRIDGDAELLREVIEIFLQDTPVLLSNLYSGIKSGDAEAVDRAAHTLKGAAANISAKRLHSLSQNVQQELKKNDVAYLESYIDDLEESFLTLDRVLREYLIK